MEFHGEVLALAWFRERDIDFVSGSHSVRPGEHVNSMRYVVMAKLDEYMEQGVDYRFTDGLATEAMLFKLTFGGQSWTL